MNANDKDLPELTDDAVRRIEANVFSEITRDHVSRNARARTRRRWIGGGISAAAVVVAAIAITPLMLEGVGPSASYDAGPASGSDSAPAEEGDMADGESAGVGAISPEEIAERRVIRDGEATLVVDDIAGATEKLTKLAAAYDGYVEHLRSANASDDASDATSGWVTLRIPADRLDGARSDLAGIGDLSRMEVSERDVTSQAIDLEARIDSLQASVDRLTDLMDNAGSVGDLIEAETALSERQSQLESYQRELDHLDDQVSMSTLDIELKRDGAAASTDPAGFGDGLLTGWNGLIVFLNGLVVAFGFLLPWIGVFGVAGLIVWFVVRLIRRRGRSS